MLYARSIDLFTQAFFGPFRWFFFLKKNHENFLINIRELKGKIRFFFFWGTKPRSTFVYFLPIFICSIDQSLKSKCSY